MAEALVLCLLNETKYQSRVRVGVRSGSCLGSRFVSGLVFGFAFGSRPGSCLDSCLVGVDLCGVRVWLVFGFVSGGCPVRVRFVFGSYQGSRSDSWLDSYAYKVRIRLYIYFKSWIIVEFINILYLIVYFDVYLI